MFNGHCGRAGDHKLHTAEQDAPLGIWEVEVIPIPEGTTA